MNTRKLPLVTYLMLSLFSIGATTALRPHHPLQSGYPVPPAQEPEPTPMMGLGRFEVPELPENPTQVEVGENLYFYHCMPCHGDYGQGLTNEFREAWVDDHQNCWARGCHAGRLDDEGFPIPKYIPPVITSQLLVDFPMAQMLHDFLRSEHPPQNPGILKDDEYWAVTAFLWFENGQLPSGVELGLEEGDPIETEALPLPESETEPVEVSQTEPVEASQTEPVEASQTEPVEASQIEPVEASQTEPIEVSQTESASESSPGLNIRAVGMILIGLGLLVLLVVLIQRKRVL